MTADRLAPPQSGPPPPPAAYHPRAMLLVAVFGPPIRRASIGGLAAGVAAGGVAGFGATEQVPWPVVALVAAASAALVGTVVAIALLPTTIRRAYEAFSWLGHRDVARFREATGSRTPTNAAETREWLGIYPRGSVPAWMRAEMLIALGAVDEARAELDAAGPPRTEQDRLEVLATRAYADLVETGSLDQQAFRRDLATFQPPSALALHAAVVEAVTHTRLRLAAGAPDPLEPILAVRKRLGREATTVVLRDTWLPLARSLAAFGVTAGLVLFLMGEAR
jgi:hypothetical protein